jgi:CRP/FNR family transcriptional regulator, cyclic AMP receptor protein
MKNLKLNESLSVKIKNIMTFRFLTEQELESLIRISKIEQFETDEKIISQGEINQSFYAIIHGTVKVTVQEKGRNEAYICTIGNGEIFGEAGIFTKVKRTANVICLDDTTLMTIPRDSMFKFIKDHPRSGNKILMLIIYSLLKKLKEVNQELAYERKSDADQDDIDSIIQSFMD